jgi:hypothetical protein
LGSDDAALFGNGDDLFGDPGEGTQAQDDNLDDLNDLFFRKFIVVEVLVVDCIVGFFTNFQLTRQEIQRLACSE